MGQIISTTDIPEDTRNITRFEAFYNPGIGHIKPKLQSEKTKRLNITIFSNTNCKISVSIYNFTQACC